MKLSDAPPTDPDIYRVQVVYPWNRNLLGRRLRRTNGRGRIWPERPWSRTWQAEWEGCQQAPRAFTRWGITRKARRWSSRVVAVPTGKEADDGR